MIHIPYRKTRSIFSNYKLQYIVIISVLVESQSSTANLPNALSQVMRRQLCIIRVTLAVSLLYDKIQSQNSHVNKYRSVLLVSFLLSPLVFVTGGGGIYMVHNSQVIGFHCCYVARQSCVM